MAEACRAAAALHPFGRAPVRAFVDRVRRELLGAGLSDDRCAAALGDVEDDLHDAGMEAFGALAARLDATGARDLWNRRLAEDRAVCLASAIEPLLAGSLADLLCGDAGIARRLAPGRRVVATEREQHHAATRSDDAIEDFATFRRTARANSVDTALLCTVLHHEYDPQHLLDFAAWLARDRVVIVENTVSAEETPDLHLLVDIFFNHCLNQTTLQSPASHASREVWMGLGSRHGRAEHVGALRRVPGVPLTHDIIVVTRAG